MADAIVDLRPKRANDVFAGGGIFSKVVGLQIEMSILPGSKRLGDRASERHKIVKCSTSLIVVTANRCLGDIPMAVAEGIAALPVELRVLRIGKFVGLETMRRAERHLHSEENAFIIPNLGEKIVALVQANAVERQTRVDALVNVTGQTLGRGRPVFHTGDLLVQVSMVEFGMQRAQT